MSEKTAKNIAKRVKTRIHFADAGTLAGLLSWLGGSRGEDSCAVASASFCSVSSRGGGFGGEDGREWRGEEVCAAVEDDGSHIWTILFVYVMEFSLLGTQILRKQREVHIVKRISWRFYCCLEGLRVEIWGLKHAQPHLLSRTCSRGLRNLKNIIFLGKSSSRRKRFTPDGANAAILCHENS